MFISLTLLLLASSLVMSQQPGTLTPEVHPPLPWQQCKAGGQCTTVHGEIVIDSNWRWAHTTQGQKNCLDGNKWDATACPDDATCGKNCALEGVDYQKTGVTTSGNALNQKFGSRLYLASNESHYELFKLLGQEFTFDVDMSTLKCGMNGALYFISMDADGGQARHSNNKAGAKYGTGYCDAQCPKENKFVNAITNKGQGACCAEMDIWEANQAATVYTPHPCTPSAYHICEGAACQNGVCESGGCGYNDYAVGNHDFYGPGKTVDTNKVFTVVTQFITSDGTANGHLTEIRRFYVQGGKVIPQSISKSSGANVNSISEAFCQHSDSFNKHGGLKQMGDALKTGMVLSFSLWDDASSHMLWLDGGNNGPCGPNSGVPSEIEGPNVHVTWSNIRVGPINSTFTH